MKYAVLLAVAMVGMAAGQSIEWRDQQCGWWWGRDASGHQVGSVHKVGACSWIAPEPTRAIVQDIESARPVIKICSGLTGECEVSPNTKDISNQLFTARQPGYFGTNIRFCDDPSLKDGEACVIVPEPLDVPAIQETVQVIVPSEEVCRMVIYEVLSAEKYHCHYESAKRWTCKDKTNVLLTAEDGTKWCHKIQK